MILTLLNEFAEIIRGVLMRTFLLILLLSGCSQNTSEPEPTPPLEAVYVGQGFTPGEQDIIRSAERKWLNHTTKIKVTFIFDAPPLPGQRTLYRVTPHNSQGIPKGHIGYVSDSRMWVDVTAGDTESIVLHEIGHVIGLDHTSEGIMRQGRAGDTEITPMDVAQCEAYQMCDRK